MKIVVTGGTGLLGTALAYELSPSHQLYLLSDASVVQYANCINLKADVRDSSSLANALDSIAPDAVVHTAALTNVDYCEDHQKEADELNAEAAGNVAAYCAENGIHLVHISTDYVFDGLKQGGRYTEEDEPNPLGYYAKSKFEGEKRVSEAGGEHAILRTTMYGWNVRGKKNYAMMFYEGLSQGRKIQAFENQFNTPMLANDLANAIEKILLKKATGVFNAGSAKRVNRVEFAEKLAKTFSFDSNLIEKTVMTDEMFKSKRPRDVSLDSTKLEKTIGLKTPTLEEGLARFKQLKDTGYENKFKVVIG